MGGEPPIDRWAHSRLVADGFEAMAVWVLDEGGVVVGSMVRSEPRRT
jgi:hypothetical protein